MEIVLYGVRFLKTFSNLLKGHNITECFSPISYKYV